jgi:serine/threonine protein kinase
MIPSMAGQAGISVNDRYLLLELIGQGDTGRVWRSHDRVLDREVAVKEVLLPPDLPPSDRAQLLTRMREAQAAAGLDHPSVIAIYDVTEFDGIPWVVMRLVNGPSLGDVLERDGRLRWRRVAEIGEQVADALASVHAVGVVHRDLKPDNILVAEQRAIVTDFGIAEVATTLSDPGTIIGTPHYLAPEQFDQRPVGPAADMWALGTILYEAAEGRPPFGGATLSAVIDAVLTKSPDVPASAGPLAGLIQSLLSKEASERPDAATTARALAGLRSPPARESAPVAHSDWVTADLLSSVDGTVPPPAPAAAATVSPPVQPPPAAAPAAAAPARTAAGRPPVEPRPLAVAAVSAFAVTAVIAAAIFLRVSSGPGPSPGWHPPPPSASAASPSTSPSAARAVSLTVSGSLLAKLSNPGRVDSVAFAPDGKTLAAGDDNGSTYLWNTATGHRTATFDSGNGGNEGNDSVCVAFSPDGKTVASTNVNGSTYLWDVATGTQTATLTDPSSVGVYTVAFISGGKTVATGDGNGNIYLWNAATHAQAGVILNYGGIDVFGSDGKTVAYENGAGAGIVQPTFGDGSRSDFPDPSSTTVHAIALTPDGKTLAFGDDNGKTYLWNTVTGAGIATLAEPGKQSIWSLAFTADGKILATGDFAGHVYLWDARTGKQVAALTGPGSLVTSLAFSRDGRTLAASDYGGNVYLWRIKGA